MPQSFNQFHCHNIINKIVLAQDGEILIVYSYPLNFVSFVLKSFITMFHIKCQ